MHYLADLSMLWYSLMYDCVRTLISHIQSEKSWALCMSPVIQSYCCRKDWKAIEGAMCFNQFRCAGK